MGDPGDGWQTVMPTSHSGLERLSRPQLEAYERQILRDWESSRGHWSGIGKHTGTSAQDFAEANKVHQRFKQPAPDKILGSGTYGVVEKVNFSHNNRAICLARKHIKYRRGYTIQFLREEANVMEKLEHEHIVKLVGTYCVRPHELYILLWPVAVCNLDSLFNDLDLLESGNGDRDDIVSRLHALDLQDSSAIERGRQAGQPATPQGNCPLKYLQQIVGCITRAVAYCHEANIRHLDLKPSNILLSPGSVYLADFGIAKDVNDRDRTMTMGQQGTPKWRAPEIHSSRDEWSMKAADVYSLGLVLLNISTVLYGANMADFDAVVGDMSARRAEKLAQYHKKLRGLALSTQEVEDANAPTFSPKHIVDLTARMLSSDPSARPTVNQVDTELVELGGIDQVYHSSCCKRSSRFVTDRMNTRYRQAADERDRLRADHTAMAKRLEVLEAKDETYETRIRNEGKAWEKSNSILKEQLEKERNERKRLEGLVAEMQQQGGRRPARPSIPRPNAERVNSGPASSGFTIRLRPQTHPQPNERRHAPPRPSLNVQQRGPTPALDPRPTYSQKAAAAAAPISAVARAVSSSSIRRRESIPRPISNLASPTALPSESPNPDATGFTLRSSGSASRLPRAVNPATPIRSGTPNLHRDPSSTDSTQLSMSSSTFSRLSISRHAESPAGTSVAGTPAIGSPVTNEKEGRHSRRTSDANRLGVDKTDVRIDAEHVAMGFGLGIMDRRESVSKETGSVRGPGSVVSSGAPGTVSPLLSGSALSSPRAAHAVLDTHGGTMKVPSLPTEQSWADVLKRQRRG
ncbi:kinase-like domain-containing protein [Lasiosphaeria hispida]|uniref:Kinase-like domain-containing protein n=1 Tax=Lasiosphaeria hispida TaxID=260671 RepID=A0AAJ0HFE4_9PEZI|nr:kinase-like domain-containing protein [Lasiosphaeria hispida]